MSRALRTSIAAAAAVALLAGCSATAAPAEQSAAAETVTVPSNLGEVDVAVLPERVAVLDNTAMETLLEWGITPVALPEQLVAPDRFAEWVEDDSILDVGTHREPDFEALAESAPDLILGGYRFAEYTDELQAIAPTIDIAASPEHEGGYVESLREQTQSLGAIFEREDDAAAIVAELDAAVAAATEAATGKTVFLGVVNGGKLDNGAERLSRMAEPIGMTDVFAGDAGDIHQDSGLAPETIAQADPDWVIVLDRDAAAGAADAQPAKQVIEANPALAGTRFVQQGSIVYLEDDFYRTEGAQAYTRAFDQIAQAMAD
ncbi:ABC transporter substrate-binding protein [Agrococcus sp. HG114]|uniref:ABC transporter substrate-binding protein n=1 Tax=Agrococcus sp. HG114 TaxID=2969757 RepID=UPI00215A26E8|nr:ABC transporter substrate-binding protein [Agrococcus sp. HG114]MCR8670471.1 ABC transporter substrate-binding protein [Agrococcus sp. HG114]